MRRQNKKNLFHIVTYFFILYKSCNKTIDLPELFCLTLYKIIQDSELAIRFPSSEFDFGDPEETLFLNDVMFRLFCRRSSLILNKIRYY
jgi:hypothetical protein